MGRAKKMEFTRDKYSFIRRITRCHWIVPRGEALDDIVIRLLFAVRLPSSRRPQKLPLPAIRPWMPNLFGGQCFELWTWCDETIMRSSWMEHSSQFCGYVFVSRAISGCTFIHSVLRSIPDFNGSMIKCCSWKETFFGYKSIYILVDGLNTI